MKYQWKVSSGSRYVDSGTIEAETQKQAMGEVLLAQEEQRKLGKRDADTSYSITCGDSTTTSYGDEFVRSAEATSWTEEPTMDEGHAFKPSLSDVGIEPDPFAATVTDGCAHEWEASGFAEEKCASCGKLRDKQWDDTEDLVKDIGKQIVKKVITEALDKMINATPVDTGAWGGWDRADATPAADIQQAKDKMSNEQGQGYAKGGLVDPAFPFIPQDSFVGNRVFPKKAPSANSVLSSAFGSKARHVADMIQSYGHRPEDVVEVYRDPSMRAHRVRGRLYDRDGKEMAWQIMIDDMMIHHLPH
tara:strand:- start:21566 stop:22474 length:909 start_codon:yes stop_codon:yes gene_type:complete